MVAAEAEAARPRPESMRVVKCMLVFVGVVGVEVEGLFDRR